MIPDSVYEIIDGYGMLEYGDRVVVGLSGGADSVCLLSVLCTLREKLNLDIIAAHVNHGIRDGEATRDEEFCVSLCNRLEVPIEILHADVPALAAQSSQGLEECGRHVRYDFFDSLAGDGGKIAVAHNMNDVAETLIFNLTRGTSLKGAGSIQPVRGNIIRPLIETPREEIERYLSEHSLSFVTDGTNLENTYARNKIRNLVLPVLREINPEAVEAMAGFCRGARVDEAYLSSVCDKAYSDAVSDFEADRAKLLSLEMPIRSRVAKKYLESLCEADVLSKHVEDFLTFADGDCDGLQTAGGLRLVARGNIIRPYHGSADAFSVTFEKKACTLEYPYGTAVIEILTQKDLQKLNKQSIENLIDCDKIGDRLILRSRKEGDRITIGRRGVTKTLKKLFNEDCIEVEKRNTVAVLESDGRVVWVQGYSVNSEFAADSDTAKYLSITIV